MLKNYILPYNKAYRGILLKNDMRRKVIQLAGKTSVVSLPNVWVRKYGIKKGDDLEVEELADSLIIKTVKGKSEVKRISINIDGFNKRTLSCAVSALHKLGYDEISFTYSENRLNETIQDSIKNLLLGFVVIEQTSKKTVLKNVSNEIESEFNSTLRRAFLVTNSLAESTLEMIKNKQFSKLISLIDLEKSNNQLTSFCLRLINKGLYKEPEKQLFITTIVWNLEKIADEYKAICVGLSKNSEEISKEILVLYKDVNRFLNSYYELMYRFSVEAVNALVNRKQEIIDALNSIRPRNRFESQLLNNLWAVVSKTVDFSSSMFALYLIELK